MNRRTRHSTALALAVRAQIAAADVREAVVNGAQRRVARLRDDGESGAQAAEYAMLGGVSAAACGALIALLKNKEFLQRVLDAVVSGLTKVIKSWF